MWQYCVSQPPGRVMATPLPHSRPFTAALPICATETSSTPSRTPRTTPAAAAFTVTPARITASEATRRSVPSCPS